MNTLNQRKFRRGMTLASTAAGILVLAGCATAPSSPEGAAEVRTKLTELQADTNLAGRVPVALEEADAAVQLAEQPVGDDVALGAHRVLIADRKVEIAKARAATNYAEERRGELGEERERARLDARTREADRAQERAITARSDAAAARGAAETARGNAEAARLSAAEAEREAALQAEKMQRQIDALQAEATDRGLVLTLGDVLFATGRADLKGGATGNLNKLVAFLNEYPNRNVEIEGHTDDVGSDESNQSLSERRAESVKSYLVGQGIGSQRVTASGKGEAYPLVSNTSDGGRQQNRRVEVIILNPPSQVPTASAR